MASGVAGLSGNVKVGALMPGPVKAQDSNDCARQCWGITESETGMQYCTAFKFDKGQCSFYTTEKFGGCPKPTGSGSATVGWVKNVNDWQN